MRSKRRYDEYESIVVRSAKSAKTAVVWTKNSTEQLAER